MGRHYVKKIKSWTNEGLQNALDAVEDGLPCRQAAHMHKVPYHIVKCRLDKKLRGEPFIGQGKKPPLNKEEETNFAYYIKTLCSFGFHPLCVNELIELSTYIIARRGVVDGTKIVYPGKSWAEAFAKRHKFSFKEMRMLKWAHIKPSCVKYQKVVQNFYDSIEEVTISSNLGPNQIWTIYEVGFPNYFFGSDLEFDTNALDCTNCVAFCSASGQALAPLVIQAGNHSSPKRYGSTFCASTETGCLTADLFQEWFYSVWPSMSVKPLFIIVDSALSYLSLDCIEFAVSKGIRFIKQPCSTKKPLDLCFEQFKVKWLTVLQNWMKGNMKLMSEQDFMRQLSGIWYRCLSQKLIVEGFELSGIYPYDRRRLPSFLSHRNFAPLVKTNYSAVTTTSIQDTIVETSEDVYESFSPTDQLSNGDQRSPELEYAKSICKNDIKTSNETTTVLAKLDTSLSIHHCWCRQPPPPVPGKRWIPLWSLVDVRKYDRSARQHQIKDSKVVLKRLDFITNASTYKISEIKDTGLKLNGTTGALVHYAGRDVPRPIPTVNSISEF